MEMGGGLGVRYVSFSPKQRQVLGWWTEGSPVRDRDAIICDGAVRSGKTMTLSMSFVLWAMHRFSGKSFAICGKTVRSCERNVVLPLLEMLERDLGMSGRYNRSGSWLEVRRGARRNRFYLFGGRNESSADLVQGITLAGVLLDEVALMPRSFVEQALARCSVEGSRFWFSCNPRAPSHWFYREWISDLEGKNAFYLHFSMEDNPSLSRELLARYRRLYTGLFYQRLVLGRWVQAEGLVYPMFDPARNTCRGQAAPGGRWFVSVDYGSYNPCAMLLWQLKGGVARLEREFYHDARRCGRQLDDQQYYEALVELAGERPVERVIVDPSAASFIACVHRQGRFSVWRADNAVLDGIRGTASAMGAGRLVIHRRCENTLRELEEYAWDEGAGGDRPRKESDHAMDAMRYFVQTVLRRELDWWSEE